MIVSVVVGDGGGGSGSDVYLTFPAIVIVDGCGVVVSIVATVVVVAADDDDVVVIIVRVDVSYLEICGRI